MGEVRPFEFEMMDDESAHAYPCHGNGCVYPSVVWVPLGIASHDVHLRLCCSCLDRMRATLKAALKALPVREKQPRPDDPGRI